jgi:hypothetical protein
VNANESAEPAPSLATPAADPLAQLGLAGTDHSENPLAVLDRLASGGSDGKAGPTQKTAVPPPDGAHRIFSFGRKGAAYDIDVYAVDTMGVLDNARAHRKRLESAGFRVQSPDVGPRRVTMVATRGQLRAMVVTVGEKSGASTTSVVTATATGALPAGAGGTVP